MKPLLRFLPALVAFTLAVSGCWLYSFSGTSIQPDVKTICIEPVENKAMKVNPSLATNLFEAMCDKYKKLTIRYQVEFTIILFYSVIVTALQVIATPKLMEGAMQFIAYWFQALVDFDANVIGFGHKVANISSLIPNPTASGIVFWVLLILISVIVIGIVYLTIHSVIITYVRYLKANQFDRYTVIAAITALAFTIFLANVIKGIAPINLFAIQIGLFLAYSGIRALVVSRR